MVTGDFALPPHYPEKASICKRLNVGAGHPRVNPVNRFARHFDETLAKQPDMRIKPHTGGYGHELRAR